MVEENIITDYCKSCGHFSCKCDKEYCPNYVTPKKIKEDIENISELKIGKHTQLLNIVINNHE